MKLNLFILFVFLILLSCDNAHQQKYNLILRKERIFTDSICKLSEEKNGFGLGKSNINLIKLRLTIYENEFLNEVKAANTKKAKIEDYPTNEQVKNNSDFVLKMGDIIKNADLTKP